MWSFYRKTINSRDGEFKLSYAEVDCFSIPACPQVLCSSCTEANYQWVQSVFCFSSEDSLIILIFFFFCLRNKLVPVSTCVKQLFPHQSLSLFFSFLSLSERTRKKKSVCLTDFLLAENFVIASCLTSEKCWVTGRK